MSDNILQDMESLEKLSQMIIAINQKNVSQSNKEKEEYSNDNKENINIINYNNINDIINKNDKLNNNYDNINNKNKNNININMSKKIKFVYGRKRNHKKILLQKFLREIDRNSTPIKNLNKTAPKGILKKSIIMLQESKDNINNNEDAMLGLISPEKNSKNRQNSSTNRKSKTQKRRENINIIENKNDDEIKINENNEDCNMNNVSTINNIHSCKIFKCIKNPNDNNNNSNINYNNNDNKNSIDNNNDHINNNVSNDDFNVIMSPRQLFSESKENITKKQKTFSEIFNSPSKLLPTPLKIRNSVENKNIQDININNIVINVSNNNENITNNNINDIINENNNGIVNNNTIDSDMNNECKINSQNKIEFEKSFDSSIINNSINNENNKTPKDIKSINLIKKISNINNNNNPIKNNNEIYENLNFLGNKRKVLFDNEKNVRDYNPKMEPKSVKYLTINVYLI